MTDNWGVNAIGCCCGDRCTNAIPCCLDYVGFDINHWGGTDATNPPVLSVESLGLTGPGITTDNWANGAPNVQAGPTFPGLSIDGNIICHHLDLDARDLLCPSSASATVQIAADLRNCGPTAVNASVGAASWGLGWFRGGNPNVATRECQQTQLAPDGFGNNPDNRLWQPGDSRAYVWTFRLPIVCPELCVPKSVTDGWTAQNGGTPPNVVGQLGTPCRAGDAGQPPTLANTFGCLGRACWQVACSGRSPGAPLSGVNGFFASCFGSSPQNDCNQQTQPRACPDCFWRALSRDQQNSTNPDPAGYGQDPRCRCGCKGNLANGLGRPGARSRFCIQPPRNRIGGSIKSGTARVLFSDLLEPAVWTARDNDSCQRRRVAGFSGNCYRTPIGQICLNEAAAPQPVQDAWLDLTAALGQRGQECATVPIQWQEINNGDGTFALRIDINGITWTKQIPNPPANPSPDGEVFWDRDNQCL